MKKSVLVWLLLCVCILIVHGQNKQLELKENWQFRQLNSGAWYSANVPASVQQNLFENQMITDPNFSDNENKQQWIAEADWEYRCHFQLTDHDFTFKNIDLECEGLDTYAAVFVNDSLVMSTDNMFRTWICEVKKHLKIGENNMRFVFSSPLKRGLESAAQLPYNLPESERVFTRKSQFQYGWDFAPRLLTCGIYKPVSLKFRNQLKINSVQMRTLSLNDTLARVALIYETLCDSAGDYQLGLQKSPRLKFKKSNFLQLSKIHLELGINYDTLILPVKNPKLWWCNGHGVAFLYNYIVSISMKGSILDEKELSFGLKRLELVQENDSAGCSFYFKLNGQPIYAKGANVVPGDALFSAQALQKQIQLVADAKQSGMNFIRVWGGGVYASDEFYQACDKNGILVWQDFMFAGAMYPGDSEFTTNVKNEVKDQLLRLRNHPSLALWCGNNEIKEAWFNWGWQKQFQYSVKDSTQIWKDYENLFQKVIPDLVHQFDPDRNYYPTSPAIGWGHKESLTHGDSHYWGIWWGMEPFSVYRNKVPRFSTEFGFQSFPDLSTIQQFSKKEELYLGSPSLKAHQKHKTGFETIQTYMERDYPVPDDLRTYIYVSQLLQRDGMKMAIEAQRSSKPKCMGSLFWQMNDCWPALSWSATDYYGRHKAFYYELKNSFSNILITGLKSKKGIQINLVSDSIATLKGEIKAILKNFKGEVLWTNSFKSRLDDLNAGHYFIDATELPQYDSTKVYLDLSFNLGEKVFAKNRVFFTAPKNLSLPKPNITITRKDQETLNILSDVYCKDIHLYMEFDYLDLSDNDFDLEPGETKHLKILSPIVGDKPQPIKYILLNNL